MPAFRRPAPPPRRTTNAPDCPRATSISSLDRFFHITERGSTVARELRGGLAPLLHDGLLIAIIVMVRGVRGAILIVIVGATVLAVIVEGVAQVGRQTDASGALVNPRGWALAVPKLPARRAACSTPRATRRTRSGSSSSTRWLLRPGRAASVSSNTSYIESASGVGEGARTGLASVVTGLLFLLATVFAPLVAVVPYEAATPALVIVGFLTMQQARGWTGTTSRSRSPRS